MVLAILENAKKAAAKGDSMVVMNLLAQADNEARAVLFRIIPDEVKKLQELVESIDSFRKWFEKNAFDVKPNHFNNLIEKAREVDLDALRTLKLERR